MGKVAKFFWTYGGVKYKIIYGDVGFGNGYKIFAQTNRDLNVNTNKLNYWLLKDHGEKELKAVKKEFTFTSFAGDDTITKTGGGVFTGSGNDVVTAFSKDGGREIHVYTGAGNDHINMNFLTPTRLTSGHHVKGDFNDAKNGHDVFNFANPNSVRDKVGVGRLEDFDPTWDEIRIEGRKINLNALPNDVKIVAFNGTHNDGGSGQMAQRWIVIENDYKGLLFYALDGARVNMQFNGGREGNRDQEEHFMRHASWQDILGNNYSNAALKKYILNLPEVSYKNHFNYVPEGISKPNGKVINDYDNNRADVNKVIIGSARNDDIAAGLNDDTVKAGNGNDRVWGGDGYDTLFGQTGNDELYGNHGDDRLFGYHGNDRLSGGFGNDRLFGGTGSDRLLGLFGNDRLYGGTGNDFLYGGTGNDRLYGSVGNDRLYGGTGDDVFVFGDRQGTDWIRDLETGRGSSGHDIILIDSDRIDSYVDVRSVMSKSGSSVKIDFGGGHKIILENTSLAEMNADMFDFV